MDNVHYFKEKWIMRMPVFLFTEEIRNKGWI